MNVATKKALEFLAGLGVEIPEDKHEQFSRDFFKQFKTAAEVSQTTEKLEAANTEITRLTSLYETASTEIQGFKDMDVEGIQAKIKQYETDLAAKDTAHAAELMSIKRKAETKEFLSSQKFINTETASYYENALNAALEDKANEGKNRKDIFESLIVGEDGKPRTDIFVPPENPNKLDIPPMGEDPGPTPRAVPPKLI